MRIISSLALLAITLAAVPAGAQVDASTGCGNVGYQGCCIDDTHSQYCSSGVLKTKTCGVGDAGITKPTCGWVAASNFYSCTSGTGSDPNGKYPRLCSALPDGGPIPGVEAGVKKEAGVKVDTGTAKDSGPAVPCGKIPAAGCCADDTHTKYCDNGSLKSKTCTGTQQCGWVVSSKPGYYCGSGTATDPAGTPRSCSAYEGDGGATTKDTGATKQDKGGGTGDQGGAADVNGTVDSIKKKDVGTTKPGSSDSGCSCTVGDGSSSLSTLLLLAGLALVVRRRR